MTSGLLYQLASVPWDWFGTLTFGMKKVRVDDSQGDLLERPSKFKIVGCAVPSLAIRYCMYFKWLRQNEHLWKLKKTQWVLRHEKGELNERPHFHFLIRGLPPKMTGRHFRLAAMNRWEILGGGMARIRRFSDPNDPRTGRRSGESTVNYVAGTLGANAYELSKFELDGTEIRLSPALLEFLEERSKKVTVKADLEKVQVAPTGPRP